MNEAQMWEHLIEQSIATEEELQLVTDINGYNTETMESVLYTRTGYNSFDQLHDEE